MSSKVRIDLEFPIHTSPSFLYQYISTPDSMGEWFADNVNSRGKKFIFIWDDSEEVAERIAQKMTCLLDSNGKRMKTKVLILN